MYLSSPRELEDKSTIELAVKYADYPPAMWVHTKDCVLNEICYLTICV